MIAPASSRGFFVLQFGRLHRNHRMPCLDDSLSHALAQFEKLITRPAESFADPALRSAEFTQRLERTRLLMQQMGNPQNAFRSIHITGTSGKGSIAIMCEGVLHAAGVRVGTHTSPYLQTPLEKVR